MLREIAWRLREIGNDGRICDLIDSQVTVIEKGTDQFSSEEAESRAACGLRAPSRAGLWNSATTTARWRPAAETEAAAPSPATPEMAAAAEMVGAVLAREAAGGTVRFAGQVRRETVLGGERARNAAGRQVRRICRGTLLSRTGPDAVQTRPQDADARMDEAVLDYDRDGDGRAGSDQRRRDRRSDSRASPPGGAAPVAP